MQIKTENIPSYRISFLRKTGPYGIGNKDIMEKLKSWARNNSLLNSDSIIFGIAQDDPQLTTPEVCRYDVCVVVPESYISTDTNIHSGNISGGEYAIFIINHTEEGVKKGWENILAELEKSEFSIDASKPILERYTGVLVKKHYCEICVPVK